MVDVSSVLPYIFDQLEMILIVFCFKKNSY